MKLYTNTKGKINKLLSSTILTGIVGATLLLNTAYAAVVDSYKGNPALCPATDATSFPGQNCTPQNICGYSTDAGNDYAQCYSTSALTPSGSGNSGIGVSSKLLSGVQGGYILNCNVAADAAAPYCDNSGSFWCNADTTCLTNKVVTTCTSAKWATDSGGTATDGAFTCATAPDNDDTNCLSGYISCDGNTAACEVTKNSTNYPTGANNHYGTSCLAAAARCDTGYLDCDSTTVTVGNGCEAARTNGGACTNGTAPGVWSCTTDVGGSCTDGDTNYTCTCNSSQHFITGTEATDSTSDPLLWGTQEGSGRIAALGNSTGEKFVIDNLGNIGVGITVPTALFDIYTTAQLVADTDVDWDKGDNATQRQTVTITPNESLALGATYTGKQNIYNVAASNPYSLAGITITGDSISIDNNSTDAIDWIIGANITTDSVAAGATYMDTLELETNYTGTDTEVVRGLFGTVRATASSLTDAVNITGIDYNVTARGSGLSEVGTLNATYVYGMDLSVGAAVTAGPGGTGVVNVANMYGINLVGGTDSGPNIYVDNAYGLYIDGFDDATNASFAVYAKNGKNYFGGNVGIGTTAPLEALQVANPANSGGIILKPYAGITHNTISGKDGEGLIINAFDIGAYPSTPGAQIILNYDGRMNFQSNNGGLKDRLYIRAVTGNVGIGTSAPNYLLQVGDAGDGSEARANAWNTLSDKKYKDDIEPIDNGSEVVNKLQGVTYKWKVNEQQSAGFIAQDLEKVLPNLVSTDSAGIKSIEYSGIIPYVVEAVKAQKNEIADLQERVTNTPQSSPTIPTDILGDMTNIYDKMVETAQALGLSNEGGKLLVQSDLSVSGATTLAELTVSGTISAGLIQIQPSDSSINTTGAQCYNESTGELNNVLCQDQALYIQNTSSGYVSLYDGKILFRPDGSVKADEIEVTKALVDEVVLGADSKLVGSADIQAGESSIKIDSDKVKGDSKIFTSALDDTKGKTLYIKEKAEGSYFVVSSGSAVDEEVRFDWWIVNTE